MQSVLIAGIDLTDAINGVDQDIRYPETFGLREGAVEGSNVPTKDKPSFVLIHSNDRDQHDFETYRFFLAWDIFAIPSRELTLEDLHKIANLVSLYNSQPNLPPEYLNLASKPGVKFGIYSVGSDLEEPPQYYY